MGFNDEAFSLSSSAQPRTQKSTPRQTINSSRHNNEIKEKTIETLETIRAKEAQSKDTCTAFVEYIAAELRTLSAEQATVARAKLRRAFNTIMDEVTLVVCIKCLILFV